jgi:REP element-mobilizing transposase RayT
MNHKDYIDFDTNEASLAYLITIRCYRTWLHGDERGSMDRRENHRYCSPKIAPNKALQSSEALLLKHPPVKLEDSQRTIIEAAIREVCDNRRYQLQAVNVRTNHVHSVVAAACKPEFVMNTFKAYATRHLREKGLIPPDVKPWSRHGGTRYLWRPHHVERAIDYMINGQQKDEPPDFDDTTN